MGVLEVFMLLYAAYSAYSTAKASKDAAEYNAAVAENNKTMAEYEKVAEADRGAQEELDLRRQTRQFKGAQITSMAAAGLDLTEGSAADILAGTDYMGEVDALRVRDQTARNQWAIGEKAKGYAGESAMQKAKAKAKSINPALAAGGSILMGASKVASTYKAYGNSWL